MLLEWKLGQLMLLTDEAYIWIEYGFLNQVNGFSELDDVL